MTCILSDNKSNAKNAKLPTIWSYSATPKLNASVNSTHKLQTANKHISQCTT